MTDNLHFEITRTKDDHVRAYRTFCWRSRILKAFWLLMAAYVGFRALDLFNGFLNGEVSDWSQAQGTVSLIAVISLLFCYAYFVDPVLGAHSVPKTGVTWSIAIDKDGITESSPQEDIGAKWGMFSAALETKEDFLLVRGRSGYRFYPKRKLDRQTAGHFRELIRNNISGAKLRSPGHDNVELGQTDRTVTPKVPPLIVSADRIAREAETSEGFEFELTLTKDDYKRAYRMFMRRSRYFRGIWVIMSVVLLYYISDDVVRLIQGDDVLVVLISAFPLLFLYIIWMLFVYYFQPARVARSAPEVGVTFDINVSDVGILVRSASINTRLGWGSFADAIETAEDFLFFRGGAAFNAYPKRMLVGPQEVERFREMIRKNIPKAKLLSASV